MAILEEPIKGTLDLNNFVDGELIPCDTGDCGAPSRPVTAVEPSSWGRIKASFAD